MKSEYGLFFRKEDIMLKFSNLTKTFGDKTILNNVSFQINNPAHLHVLTGESGSGKTT